MSKAKYISKLVDASGSTTSANVSYTGTLTGSTGILNIGSGQLYKDASGNVGIGTSSPATQLHIASATAKTRIDTTAAASNNPELQLTAVARQFNIGVGGATFATTALQGSYYIYDNTAATYRMVIDSSGNVGIGTSSPAGKLHVSGGRSFFAASSEPFAVGARYSAAGGTVYFGATDATVTPGVQISAATGSPLLNIDSSGNVGIGTSSPSAKLTVRNSTDQNFSITAGTTYGGADGISIFSANDANNAYKDIAVACKNLILNASGGTGNVGIGTSSPAVKLDVTGSQYIRWGNFDALTINGSSTNSVGFRIQNTVASGRNWNIGVSGGGVGYAGSFFIFDDTAGVGRLIIDSSGNVGIGTTAPNNKLTVGAPNGTVGAGTVASFSGANVIASNSSGMVVITPTDSIAANIGGSIGFAANGTLAGYPTGSISGRRENATAGDYSSYMQFTTSGSNGSVQEKMRIDSSGNVGIGTSSPDAFDSTGKPLVVGSGSGNQGITIYAGATGYSSVNFADGTTGSARYAGQVSYDHTNNALLFATNTGTERMRIDSAGRVTMPYQPRFMAYRSGNQTGYTGGTAVIFNNATINVGNHYNATTGLFTAPVAGNYIFEVGIYMSGSVVQIWPLVNGGRVESILVTSLGDTNITATTVRYLNANDTYCLVPYANATAGLTVYDNGLHTYFRGSLIG